MKKPHRCILLAFIVWVNLKESFSLPVPEDELDTSTRLLGSSVVTSVSIVTGGEKNGGRMSQSRKVISGLDLPPSPGGLLRPDRFQFYTLNKNGEVVTKQMTEKEIQTLIAAGGGHFPTEIHETQTAGDVPTSGMKVADVVQNVQNVLKSELSKPTTVMTSVPTIPGHATDEWSSILPSILAGDMETQSLAIPDSEIIEMKNNSPILEMETKPQPTSDSKLKPNITSTTSTKKPIKEPENPPIVMIHKPIIENHFKKPIIVDSHPHDSIPVATYFEQISTTKPDKNPEKLSPKPLRPNDDSPSKFSVEKPTKPLNVPQGTIKKPSYNPSTSEKPIPSKTTPVPLKTTPLKTNPIQKTTQAPLRTTPSKTTKRPYYTFRPEYPPVSYSEIPMIPVHVITADQIMTSTPLYQKDTAPVFQVLNTISADTASNSTKIIEDLGKFSYPVYKPDKTTEKPTSERPKTTLPEIIISETSLYTKLPELVTVPAKTEVPILSVISETHTTSVKIPGFPEIPVTLEKVDSTVKPEIKTTIAMKVDTNQKLDKPLVDDHVIDSIINPLVKPTAKPLGDDSSDSEVDKASTMYDATTLLFDSESTINFEPKTTTPMFETKATTTPKYESKTTKYEFKTTPKYESKTTTKYESKTTPKDESKTTPKYESETTSKYESKTTPKYESTTTPKFASKATTEKYESLQTTQALDSKAPVTDDITETTDADFTATSPLNKYFETTEYISEVTALKETQFQRIPNLSDEVISPETSAIEKIIETLHNPAESKFGTSTIIDINAEDQELEFSTTFRILGEDSTTNAYTFNPSTIDIDNTETVSTKIKSSTIPTVDQSLEMTTKPYEPLPTELADSLSSMISQISEAVPSLVSQNSLLTEEPLKDDFDNNDTYQQNTESSRVTQDLLGFETTFYKHANVDIGATVRMEDSTENLKDLDSTSRPESEISKTDESVKESSTILSSESPISSPMNSVTISSSTSGMPFSVLTSSATSSLSSASSPAIFSVSSSSSSSTASSSATFATEASATSLSTADTTEKLKTSSLMEQPNKPMGSENDQIPQSDESHKVSSVDTTEKPIIRVDVTEAGSTIPPADVENNGITESSVIRIHMADAVSMINNLLETAPPQTTASYVPLTLPENENSSPNLIGSGLVAGFLPKNETKFVPVKLQNEASTDVPLIQIKETENKITEDVKNTTDKIQNSDSKTKDSEDKTKDTEGKIKSTESGTKNNEGKIENTEDNKDKIKLSEEKIKDQIKDSEEKIEVSTKVEEKIKTTEQVEKVQNTEEIKKEETTKNTESIKEEKIKTAEQVKDKINTEEIKKEDKIKNSEELKKKDENKNTEEIKKEDKIKNSETIKKKDENNKVEEKEDKIKNTEEIKKKYDNKNTEDMKKADKTKNNEEMKKEDNTKNSGEIKKQEKIKIEEVDKDQRINNSDQNKKVTNEAKIPSINDKISSLTAEKEINSNESKTKVEFKTETPSETNLLTTIYDKFEVTTKKMNENTTPNSVNKIDTPISLLQTQTEDKLKTTITSPLKKNATKTPLKSDQIPIIQKESPTKLENITNIVINTTPKSFTKISTTTATKSNTKIGTTTIKSNIENTVTTPKSTSIEPSKLVSQSVNKTRKPEIPVVRIDISPETNQMPSKLPMNDPIFMIHPEPVEKISKPINSSFTQESEANVKVTLINADQQFANDNKLKRVDATTAASVVDQTKKIGESQELRIRVNDTAVLVSKIPSPMIPINETKTKQSSTEEKNVEASQNSTIPAQILQNDTKMVIVNTTQSEKVHEEMIPIGFTVKPISNHKEIIDQSMEDAYNKLGEFTKPIGSSKKNVTTFATRPQTSGNKVTKPVRPLEGSLRPGSFKPPIGSSTTKPLESYSEPSGSVQFSTSRPSAAGAVQSRPSGLRPSSGSHFSRPSEAAGASGFRPSSGASSSSSSSRPGDTLGLSGLRPSSGASSSKPADSFSPVTSRPSGLSPSSGSSSSSKPSDTYGPVTSRPNGIRPSSGSSSSRPADTGPMTSRPSGLSPASGSSSSKPANVSVPSGFRPPSGSVQTQAKPNFPTKVRPNLHEPLSPKPTDTTKIKKPDENLTDDKWALIPQPNTSKLTKPTPPKHVTKPQVQQPQVALDSSQSAIGLDASIRNLEPDVIYFSNLCNELAFSFWSAANKGLSTTRSLVLSPFGMTSLLAMVFLGARGPTSNEMNDVLKLDDVATFNPHLVFQNITDTVSLSRKQGIANAAFVRELFADKSKVGKLMPFYKKQAHTFYEGIAEEVNFAAINDIVKRRTNLLIKKQTDNRIKDFVRTNTVSLRPPLAALSANVFQTECSGASSDGRDGELYFSVSPAIRQRQLVRVPATLWKSGVLAGYEPSLDATAIALGGIEKLVSTIFVIPGQQGHMAPGDNLDNLEIRLMRGAQYDGAWEKLLKVLIPRSSLELQVPKFSHRSIVNATAALKRMGLGELFSKHADLKGINGIGQDLHFADILQINLFSTCGDENISIGRHHMETYPEPPMRNYRKMTNDDDDDDSLDDEDFYSEEPSINISSFENNFSSYESISRTARKAEGIEKPKLKLDRPFLYFVRHNPTGLILHMGRFNPRITEKT